jgi:hypothetical protein
LWTQIVGAFALALRGIKGREFISLKYFSKPIVPTNTPTKNASPWADIHDILIPEILPAFFAFVNRLVVEKLGMG